MSKKFYFITVVFSLFALACSNSNNINQINFSDTAIMFDANSQTLEVSETTPELTLAAIKNKSHVILDVREQDEYQAVHIKEVKLLPLSVLASEIGKLDKNVKYITVCRSGVRSAKAAEEMQKLGLNVESMKGGMNSWIQKGLPVVTPAKKKTK